MSENWVERRHKRDQNLERAGELWKDACAAIKDCCESYNNHYSSPGKAQAHAHPVQGDTQLIVAVPGSGVTANIQFNAANRSITTRVEEGLDRPSFGISEFHIEADETHAFITHKESEISLDEFARRAIEDALFKRP